MTERPRAWTGFVPWPHDAHGTVQLADVVHRYGRGGEDVTVVGLLLLDEPFAALDALTRERLQEDVRRVTAQTGRTTVFVTHSAEEAVFLGSRIVVLAKGPGTVALDLPIDLPRGDIDAEELRESREFADLRTRISHAVKTAAAG